MPTQEVRSAIGLSKNNQKGNTNESIQQGICLLRPDDGRSGGERRHDSMVALRRMGSRFHGDIGRRHRVYLWHDRDVLLD